MRARLSKRIPAGQFKNQCLALMDEVAAKGGELVITKHGRPVVRILPVEDDSLESVPIVGSLAGSVTFIEADVTSPVAEVWDADQDD